MLNLVYKTWFKIVNFIHYVKPSAPAVLVEKVGS
jgi:hypothetical protein